MLTTIAYIFAVFFEGLYGGGKNILYPHPPTYGQVYVILPFYPLPHFDRELS